MKKTCIYCKEKFTYKKNYGICPHCSKYQDRWNKRTLANLSSFFMIAGMIFLTVIAYYILPDLLIQKPSQQIKVDSHVYKVGEEIPMRAYYTVTITKIRKYNDSDFPLEKNQELIAVDYQRKNELSREALDYQKELLDNYTIPYARTKSGTYIECISLGDYDTYKINEESKNREEYTDHMEKEKGHFYFVLKKNDFDSLWLQEEEVNQEFVTHLKGLHQIRK